MRLASFNVLADAYLSHGDYSHVDPDLLQPGARQRHIIREINSLGADVIGLQEADYYLHEAFEDDGRWQTLWAPKGRNKPDGCLTLVKDGLEISNYESSTYDDETGSVYQITMVGRLAVANSHMKWAPADDPSHVGAAQTKELLAKLDNYTPAVILADCNDRPGGPVKKLFDEAGFLNMSGDRPTALVNGKLAALDLLAVRGVHARWINRNYDLTAIPNRQCASDHIPLVADLDV